MASRTLSRASTRPAAGSAVIVVKLISLIYLIIPASLGLRPRAVAAARRPQWQREGGGD